MRAVWRQHPVTASEVIRRLTAADSSWHPKTARTLLARLVQKKALGYHAEGRRYVYSPMITEQECVTAAGQSFLERCFGGALTPMLAHFVKHRRLTREELGELRSLLDEAHSLNDEKPGRRIWKR